MMTSLADREHAMETYFALTALSSFNERVRRRKALMSRLITGAGVHGAEATALFAKFLGACATNTPDRELGKAIAAELATRGIDLSHDIPLDVGEARSKHASDRAVQGSQSWVEYVADEILLLFDGPRRNENKSRHYHPA
jgi:hypothetical protein